MDNTVLVQAGCILTPVRTIAPGAILVEGEKIAAIGAPAAVPAPTGTTIIDARDRLVVPGFVDTHVHGREGHLFGEDLESTLALCQSIASTGVTSLLPTLGAQPTLCGILDGIRAVRQAMQRTITGAEILGIHMEGPFLSTDPTARGSQPAAYLRQPSLSELHQMVEAAEGSIRKMSIAPELAGAMDVIRELARLNILPSAAHSAATYEEAMESVRSGLRCATHTFNGMIPFHHRRPGLLGAVLNCDDIKAELIGDGQHVGDVAMKLLLRCKGLDGVHLVTDNTRWAGLPNGTYEDPERNRTVVKEDQKVFVVQGTLAGSVATMNFDVYNLTQSTGCSLADAIQMATLNPALAIGVADRKGSLDVGKDADLLIIDDQVKVYLTMARGRIVYRAR